MENKLLMTYALLAHLKETHNSNVGGLIDIFVPIVKKSIVEYANDKGCSEVKGKNTSELQQKIKSYFGIEIPIYILSLILVQIEKEINNKSIFSIFNDGGFIINSFVFNEIDDDINIEIENVELLKNDYNNYCKLHNLKYDFAELQTFIFAQKIDIFTNKFIDLSNTNSLIPKYIKLKFTDIKIFKIISDIYLGSLISSYLELKINTPVTQTELLLDTNFFISLIDLNTEDAYLTCSQLYKLCKIMGFKFKILYSTVDQIKILLSSRIRDYANKEIGIIRDADIFGACIRRNIDKTQLERIKDNVEYTLREHNVEIIHEVQIKDLITEAKKSNMYQRLKISRQNDLSALNDSVAYCYVKRKRNKFAKEFSEVKCWFLHNSYSPDYDANLGYQIHERHMISANELLTLLWLSNPNQTDISSNTIIKGGLATYITKYRSSKIPTNKTIKAIKEKADNALKIGKIEQKDIYNICIRMSEGHLTNGDAEELAEMPDEEFIKSIKMISSQEKDIRDELLKQTHIVENQNQNIEKILKDNEIFKKEIKEKEYLIALKEYENKCNEFINSEYQIKERKLFNTAWLYILIIVIITSFWFIDKYYSKLINPIVSGIISFLLMLFSIFLIKFAEHKTIYECLKFTFFRNFRNELSSKIKEDLKNDFEQNNEPLNK